MELIGVVHLEPLPESPGYKGDIETVIKLAIEDAQSLRKGGIKKIIVENFGDIPFNKKSISRLTLSHFTNIVKEIKNSVEIEVGINVLRNDGISALAIADATGGSFVRINVLSGTMFTDQGIIEGKAREIQNIKNSLDNKIELYCDVFVKHAVPPPGYTISNQTEELLNRAGADKIIITGDGTGKEVNEHELNTLREIVPAGKLAIGSGVNETNVLKYINIADILIIGTAFKADQDVSKRVDQRSVERLIKMIK